MSATLASSTAADGRRAIIVAALMATYMQAVTISLPNAALLYIQGTLSMADDEVGWIFTSYITASVITMTMARWLAGRYGRKAIYQISIAIFALGLVLATRATTPMQFIAARVVQGGASGTLAPLSMAILLDILPPSRHARINLVAAVTLLLGLLSGPSIGGWLSEYHGWHSMFYVSLPVAGFIFLAMALSLPEKRAEQNAAVRFLRPDDVLARHDRVADDARPRRAPGVVQLGGDLGRGGCLGAGFLPLCRARPDQPRLISSIRRCSRIATSFFPRSCTSRSASSCCRRSP